MEARTLAEVRAANEDMLYSLYFPAGGRAPPAAVVGCVCLDYLRCSECERILGQSFHAIEHAVLEKQRTDHGVEGSDAAVSGMSDRLVPGSYPPSDEAISSMADRTAPGSNSRVEGFEVAISGMAARLGLAAAVGERAKEMYKKMERAKAWHYGRGWTKDRSKGPLAYAACLSIACSTDGSALSLRELARAAAADGGAASRKDIATLIAHMKRRLGELETLDAAGMADRLVPGSHPPSHEVEGFEAAISGMVARLGLPAAVGERGKEVFRKMEKARAWPHGPGRSKIRSNAPLVYAACLSIACLNEGSARSLRELALAAAGDGGAASRKEIARLVAHIRSRLEDVTGIGMVSVSNYLRRFSALLRLGEAEEGVALEAARRLHNPASVAAAIACLALERAGARKPAKDVAAATGVSNMTIYVVCRKLRPHADLLFG
ncbi:hypothetical protein VPH35_038279 [Triticum aestivum]